MAFTQTAIIIDLIRPGAVTGTAAILLWALAGLLVVVGLAGTILPALPGVPFVFMGLLIIAWIGDFQRIAWPTLTLLALLTALAVAADLVAAIFGAKRAGAHVFTRPFAVCSR